MAKYRKKPIVIEAVQVTDSTFDAPHPNPEHVIGVLYDPAQRAAFIVTLEGTMRADLGDWIITGVKGEKYPCKDEIFRLTYEPVTPATEHRSSCGIAQGTSAEEGGEAEANPQTRRRNESWAPIRRACEAAAHAEAAWWAMSSAAGEATKARTEAEARVAIAAEVEAWADVAADAAAKVWATVEEEKRALIAAWAKREHEAVMLRRRATDSSSETRED